MATYVISDIHGQYNMFIELLDKIDLKDTDTLYILGDVLDRGPHPIKTIRKLMEMPNAICLVGNHEFMAMKCLEFLMKEITDKSIEELDDEMLDKNFHTIKEVMKHCSDIRRSGSCALDIAWTACGRVEAYLERRVKLWDYAAGKVILEEAGGILCDYRGHSITNQLITNLVVGKENIVHDLISQCINK